MPSSLVTTRARAGQLREDDFLHSGSHDGRSIRRRLHTIDCKLYCLNALTGEDLDVHGEEPQ